MKPGALVRWGLFILALTLCSQIAPSLGVPAAVCEGPNRGCWPGVIFRLNTMSPTMKTAPGDTCYVGPNGDDSNPGTQDQPWNEIQHAVDSVNPDDTICVTGAVHYESVQFHQPGQEGSPITAVQRRHAPKTKCHNRSRSCGWVASRSKP